MKAKHEYIHLAMEHITNKHPRYVTDDEMPWIKTEVALQHEWYNKGTTLRS